VIVATKVMGDVQDDILRSLETSLERLKTDWIDVFQYHGDWYTEEKVNCLLAPGGPVEGMRLARERGMVRFLGFTTEGANGPASRFLATGVFDVIQICYNLIYQHPYDPSRKAGILYDAERDSMGIVIMRALTSGIFQKWIMRLDPGIAKRVDLNHALLSFVLSNPLVDAALVGMRTRDEVRQNVAIVEDQRYRFDLGDLHTRYIS
jgi:uncharacterized protein